MTPRRSPGADSLSSRVWPAGTDYARAVQSPGTSFVDPSLASATLGVGPLGMPLVASGQNAVVFLLATVSGDKAVRCFLRPPSHGEDRYAALGRHVGESPPRGLTAARWHDEGISVSGESWPIVVMPWVAGTPLNIAVEDMAEDPIRLRSLAEDWADVVRGLQSAGVAHGDLQHGNILVQDDGELALVDLDGVWVPEISVGAPAESGHPNYQHPQRTSAHWGQYVDSFPAALIELALKGLAADPTLARFLHGENLLFSRADLVDPAASEVWANLVESADPDVASAAVRLRTACRAPIEQVLVPFDELRNASFTVASSAHFAPSLLPSVQTAAPTSEPAQASGRDDALTTATVRRSWTARTKVLVGVLSVVAIAAVAVATVGLISRSNVQAELSATRDELADTNTALSDANGELAAAQAELSGARDELQKAGLSADDLAAQIDGLTSRLNDAEDQLAALRATFRTSTSEVTPRYGRIYSGTFASSDCTGWTSNADVCANFSGLNLSVTFSAGANVEVHFWAYGDVSVAVETLDGMSWSGSGVGTAGFATCSGRPGGAPSVDVQLAPISFLVDPTSKNVRVAEYLAVIRFTWFTTGSSCDPARVAMTGVIAT